MLPEDLLKYGIPAIENICEMLSRTADVGTIAKLYASGLALLDLLETFTTCDEKFEDKFYDIRDEFESSFSYAVNKAGRLNDL